MIRMKGLVLIGIALSLSLSSLKADELSNNFTANLTQPALNALAKDVGALMGGGSFHQGKALGFPLGFDVGVHGVSIGLQDDSKILSDDGSSAAALWGQVEAGLPGRINVIGRYGKFFDADLMGGGLRYGILKPSLPGLPSLSVSGLYSVLDHDLFDLNTISANLVLSFDLPFVHPYIGGGYDKTTLEPTTKAFVGAGAGVPQNLEGEASGYRAEAGVNLSVIPFTYISLGGGLANGKKMFHVGLGAKF